MAQEVEKDHGDSFCSCVTIFKEENTESENAALAAPNLCSCVHDGAAFLHKNLLHYIRHVRLVVPQTKKTSDSIVVQPFCRMQSCCLTISKQT